VASPFLRPVDGGVELSVLVQPRSSRSRFVGAHGDRLKVALAAPPVEGAANAELIDLVAETFGLARRDVLVVSGQTSRRKTLRLVGLDAARFEVVMKSLAGG